MAHSLIAMYSAAAIAHRQTKITIALLIVQPQGVASSQDHRDQRRAATTPNRNATNKLVRGARRTARRSTGITGPDCAFATTSLSAAIAAFRSAVTSPMVREASVAVSIARSGMLGCSAGADFSNSTCHPLVAARPLLGVGASRRNGRRLANRTTMPDFQFCSLIHDSQSVSRGPKRPRESLLGSAVKSQRIRREPCCQERTNTAYRRARGSNRHGRLAARYPDGSRGASHRRTSDSAPKPWLRSDRSWRSLDGHGDGCFRPATSQGQSLP